MTCIIDKPTKKALREHLSSSDSDITVHDPSIVAEYNGPLSTYVARFGECFATNHPKRSWFARITRDQTTGKWRVE